MRCFTIGGVVAVLAAALVAGLTLTRGVAGPRQKAAGYVDEIVAMHALQADIGLLRAQRQKLTETAVTGPVPPRFRYCGTPRLRSLSAAPTALPRPSAASRTPHTKTCISADWGCIAIGQNLSLR